MNNQPLRNFDVYINSQKNKWQMILPQKQIHDLWWPLPTPTPLLFKTLLTESSVYHQQQMNLHKMSFQSQSADASRTPWSVMREDWSHNRFNWEGSQREARNKRMACEKGITDRRSGAPLSRRNHKWPCGSTINNLSTQILLETIAVQKK